MNKIILLLLTLCTFCGIANLAPIYASELLIEHSSRPVQAESSMDALIPWETPISGFFIRSHFGQPVVDESKWVLKIDGLVEHPLELTLKDLQNFEYKALHAVLECSGNGRALQTPSASGVQWKRGAVGNAEWGGIALNLLLKKAGVKPEAKFATIEGADKPTFPTIPGFIRSIPLHKLVDDLTLIAWKMNRQPLPIFHGGPIRLVLPGWYGENWIKWLTHITLTDKEDTGFFMKKAYKMPKSPLREGEPWDSASGVPIEQILVQSLIVRPNPGQKLKPGKIEVHGKAFSGSGSISKVEISLNSGKAWKEAIVEAPHSTGGWQEFHLTVDISHSKELEILSRATDEKGNQQPMRHSWNPGGYLRNAVDSVKLQIVPTVPSTSQISTPPPILIQKCLTCHGLELIESQRLTPKQWEAVLRKMETFGVALTSEERTSLLKNLVQYSSDLETKIPKKVSYAKIQSRYLQNALSLKGKHKRGKVLYQKTCLGCHGDDGEGKIGPRLLGRAIPSEEFWTTVINGKRAMPSFKTLLKKQDIADLDAYLQNPRMR